MDDFFFFLINKFFLDKGSHQMALILCFLTRSGALCSLTKSGKNETVYKATENNLHFTFWQVRSLCAPGKKKKSSKNPDDFSPKEEEPWWGQEQKQNKGNNTSNMLEAGVHFCLLLLWVKHCGKDLEKRPPSVKGPIMGQHTPEPFSHNSSLDVR